MKEGRPNVVDLIKGERIHLIVNTPHGVEPWFDEKAIRRAAVHGADSDHHDAVGGARRGGRDRGSATRRSAGAGIAAFACGAYSEGPKRVAFPRRCSMAQENSALIRRWFEEVWNKGRMEAIDEMASPDAIGHGQAQHDTDIGLKEFRTLLIDLRTAFPDLKVNIDQVIEQGDNVVARWT